MRTLQEIIFSAKAALTRKRADEAEAETKEAAAQREKRAEEWKPIVEELKKHIPPELHLYISFNVESAPESYGGDHRRHIRCPVAVTLPTPEAYTVFGYWFGDKCYGFAPGVIVYPEPGFDGDDQPYFTPADTYMRNKYEVANLASFEIALAQTIEDYKPRSVRKSEPTTVITEAAQVIPLGERIESFIRAIVREEMSAE